MRATLNINDQIIDEILLFYNAKTKTEAIHKALSDWVKFKKKEMLLNLRGQVDIIDNLEELKQKELLELINHE